MVATVALIMSLAACGGDDDGGDDARPTSTTAPTSTSEATSTTTATTTTAVPTTVAPATTAAAQPHTAAPPATVASAPTAPPASAAPAATPGPPPPVGPAFQAAVAPIDESIRARMTHSWRPGCPVPLEDLRYVTVLHWNDAGQAVQGELVVHADAADAIVRAFGRLYEIGFPITRMQLVDVYGGDDRASMRANNTSAFNCRAVAGTSSWSEHAYGRAVDVNPLVNPWVRGGSVDPPEGRSYADRSNRVPGGLYAGDDAVRAFTDVGWAWGGTWRNTKDYQHFSASGR